MNFITYKNLIDKYNRNIEGAIQEGLRPYLAKHKLTYIQYQVLAVLLEDGALTIGDLSEKMNMDTGNMSATCKRLEQKGYTLRLRNKYDERVVEVSLTRSGRLVISELNDALNKRYKSKWSEISEEEQKNMLNLYETLEKIFMSKKSK